MKVNRDAPTFANITITLETREEAVAMWHLMNCPDDTGIAHYEPATSRPCKIECARKLKFDIFYAVDDAL